MRTFTKLDHIRLGLGRRYIAAGDKVTFLDGLPPPSQAELDACEARARKLFSIEEAPPSEKVTEITAVQMRLWVIEKTGNLDAVRQFVNNSSSDPKERLKNQARYDKATVVYRDDPLVLAFIAYLNMSEAEGDAAFAEAKTYR